MIKNKIKDFLPSIIAVLIALIIGGIIMMSWKTRHLNLSRKKGFPIYLKIDINEQLLMILL